jgi:polysaccharide biosynthesis transport protein
MGLQVERQAPVGIDLLQGARVPVRPDEEIPLKKMLMAALAAMMVPFGLAVGTEMLFGRVSSRRQLESIGQLSVVGEIANLPRRAPKRLGDDSRNKDVQLFEESINGLRTYLTLVESTRGRKVLAVTSSISREGKTSLAAQLAVSVAGSTGKPTLLIDGDMRSPDIHRIFEVDCGPGLSEVLAGTCRLEEAIETDFSDRLHLLTAGQLTVSPHQLIASGGFDELIEKLRGMYEHIIIDTPPILPASEALVMARAADAAIICVRRDYSRFDQVTETHNRLVASGVRIAGAVLNGVPTQHYAYRYGSYYYTTRKAEPDAPAIEETTSAV